MVTANSILNQIGAVVVTALVAGLVGFMVWALVSAIRRRQTTQRLLVNLGYTPLESPPPELMKRLDRIYHKIADANNNLEVRNAFQRLIPGGQALVFDLVDTTYDGTSWIGSPLVGIVSPALHLPWFMLQPRLDLEQHGKSVAVLATAAEKAVDWVVSHSGFVRLSFAEYPAFEERFMVFGRNEAETRQFLSAVRLGQLTSLERSYKIEAAGGMFTINGQQSLPNRNQKLTWEEDIETLVADAQRLLFWFQDNL